MVVVEVVVVEVVVVEVVVVEVVEGGTVVVVEDVVEDVVVVGSRVVVVVSMTWVSSSCSSTIVSSSWLKFITTKETINNKKIN